jgi:hypothetical protein
MRRIRYFASGSVLIIACTLVNGLAADQPVAELTTSVQQITHGPKHHFFGYFGHVRTIPWNASGNTMLVLESEFQDRMPKPGEPANIVLLDVKDNYKPRVVEQTRAWNFQQGTMLYWNPLAAETQFFFNDRDPETQEVFCVLFDTSKGKHGERVAEYRFADSPIGNSGVAQNGVWFLGINYGRLARLRPVTGYPGVKDWTVGKDRNPADDGIFKVSAWNKEKKLLVSYKQLANALRAKHPNVDHQELFINHTLWSRDDSRIFFFARADFDNREKRIDAPFTMKPDGSDLKPLTMHIGGHPEWESGHRLIGAKGKEQILFDVIKQEITGTLGTEGTFPNPGGDIALSPDGKLFINGHGSKGQNYYSILRRADGAITRTPGFNQGGYITGELRIDPSPNWNRDGTQVMVVAVDEKGTRQMFVMELEKK